MKPEISIYVSARVSRFACLGGLLTRGAFVLCIDNFFTGASRNIEDLLDHKYFEVIRHVPLYVEEDEIFSFACPPQRSIINMIQRKQMRATIDMLGWRTASASEVYGDPS